jgi:hypothetical protein
MSCAEAQQPPGARLRRAREAAGLTLAQAAGLIHCTPVEMLCWEERREPALLVNALHELLALKTGQFTLEGVLFWEHSSVDLRLTDGELLRVRLPLETLQGLERFWRSAFLQLCGRCQCFFIGVTCPGCDPGDRQEWDPPASRERTGG